MEGSGLKPRAASGNQDGPGAGLYAGLACLSAAMLAFEVLLTRIFALAQGYHFAFMAVSLALLGAGASGTFLSLFPARRGRRAVWTAGLLLTLTAPAAGLLLNQIPFDTYRIAWEPKQLLWLAAYYLVLTVPFFFGGLAVGSALTVWAGDSRRIYAANLLGSGVGPPLALAGLALLGGPGMLFAIGAVGALAVTVLAAGRQRPWLAGLPGAGLVVAFTLLSLHPPSLAAIRLTPYQPLSQALLYPDSRIIWQRWNAFSRVDVVESAGIHSAPGLSTTFQGRLPQQLGLTVDGQNLSAICLTPPQAADFCAHLPPALAFELRPEADVLIVEPGGGLAGLAALFSGARSVTVVTGNPAVAAAVRQWGRQFAADPRMHIEIDDTRSYLRRHPEQYDLILMPVADSFRPVTAGAYALGEDYRYTVETVTELWRHLRPGGLLVAERWLQLPPSESLRLWATVRAAIVQAGVTAPGEHLAALRSMQTSLILAGRQPLSASEINQIRDFARRQQFDLVYTPGLPADLSDPGRLEALGVNYYSIVPGAPYYRTFYDLLQAADVGRFYAGYEYAVAPATDDHPFFFHFFKWRQTPQILAGLGKTWQPFGGTGYLVLVVLLLLVVTLSLLLILLPLIVSRLGPGSGKQPIGRYLLYFSFTGLAFLLVEIPLLQQFIVYLGQPAYAFATVLSSLMVASGLGSQTLSGRLPLRLSLGLLVGLALVYPWLLQPLFAATFGLALPARAAVSWLALLPLGLLMGTPFPQGLAVTHRRAAGLLPWVWAVNGCASVFSAVAAPMLALDLGFRLVFLAGAVAYAGALAAGWAWGRSA